jgi:hypothetical protein
MLNFTSVSPADQTVLSGRLFDQWSQWLLFVMAFIILAALVLWSLAAHAQGDAH